MVWLPESHMGGSRTLVLKPSLGQALCCFPVEEVAGGWAGLPDTIATAPSMPPGEILVQMSDTQRHLNSDLEVVVQTFHGDLLQHMEKNTKLDMQFIKDSRQHYEIEYRHRAANLEKCMSELWRMERKRDKNVREMKESVNRLHAQMQAFVSESQRAAELEEKRRYRFLAEKHLLLSNTFLQFFGRVSCTGGSKQGASGSCT
ncbi:Brain-specific angiogenesis inhibitor 1-associated protein 2-like protein 2 [Saguinus oedipus]|uniref:Brain-specific angiogenesis inhibitor 1-associated protein 2-like protein 2 n=1 Tax=Saguinus oedipus TaxID=9490 RepID=A0ABQ9WLH6_SAGOE|nr:Brain-specific angiogenesis inhibitor 1-associated protein 2-like protein 2 [Saguinus oedipus]